MKENIIAICVLCICILSWYVVRGNRFSDIIDSQPTIKVDTVFEERIDTIHFTHMVTKYKPLPSRTDTVFVTDTITNNVVQNITKVYECDSLYEDATSTPHGSINYHLYVRTANYDVDSISLKFNANYPKVTKTIIQTITKKKHWNYGIQGGYGYGFFNNKPDLYIGIGVQYNI